jgi:hypothetical protein
VACQAVPYDISENIRIANAPPESGASTDPDVTRMKSRLFGFPKTLQFPFANQERISHVEAIHHQSAIVYTKIHENATVKAFLFDYPLKLYYNSLDSEL